MALATTKLFLGDTPIDFYYLGDTQVSLEPKSQPIIPTDGLIAYFKSSTYSGTGPWYDISGNGLVATAFSSSVFPSFDTSTNQFLFNGTSNALVANISASVATGSRITNFTEVMWIRVPSDTTGIDDRSRGVINLQNNIPFPAFGPEFDSISWNDVDNYWRLISANNGRNLSSTTAETVFNQNLMIASTRESGSGNFKIYRNDSLLVSYTGSYTPNLYQASSSASLFIAIGNRLYNSDQYSVSASWAGDGWFSGSIANVMLYNRALTAAEISEIYKAGI
jgi:hypothetical protein